MVHKQVEKKSEDIDQVRELKTPGQLLRTARLDKNMTIEVAAQTFINRHIDRITIQMHQLLFMYEDIYHMRLVDNFCN